MSQIVTPKMPQDDPKNSRKPDAPAHGLPDVCPERRRFFLQSVATLACVSVADVLLDKGAEAAVKELAPPPDLFDTSLINQEFWMQPRVLDMIRPQSGDELKITYWRDGQMNPTAYYDICELLRDVQANQIIRMDTRLIDTLWAAQAFVRRYGFAAPIVITSGYRSQATNSRLIERGLPAARNSLHTRGQAADFRMPGLHTRVVGELVQGFNAGGVGFYFRVGDKGGWIHADTGPERQWKG